MIPGIVHDEENHIRYYACGDTKVDAEIVKDNDQEILRIKGLNLGTIKHVARDWQEGREAEVETDEPRVTGVGALDDIRDLIRRSIPTADDSVVKDICYEMLRTPNRNGKFNADGSEAVEYEASLRDSFEALWDHRVVLQKPVPEDIEGRYLAEYERVSLKFKSMAICRDAIPRIVGWYRRRFVTDTGFFGLGPHQLEEGDVLVIMHGASVPYVLRKQSQTRCTFLGTAYVRGAMEGETIGRGSPEEIFHLE